jgi:hypothetical protein
VQAVCGRTDPQTTSLCSDKTPAELQSVLSLRNLQRIADPAAFWVLSHVINIQYQTDMARRTAVQSAKGDHDV